jgi:PAS domain S-box-containing protein
MYNTKVRTKAPAEKFEKLLDEAKLLSSGFEFLTDHVVITDKHGNIVYANKAAEENTGYTREEMVGKNPGDLWGGNMDQDFYRKMWYKIKIEKMPFIGEVINRRKDGRQYWQEIHVFPVLDETKEAKFFIGIEPDITRKKEQELFHTQFLSAFQNQMTSNVSATYWVLDWLITNGRLSRKQKEKLADIYKNNNGILKMVHTLVKNR